MAVKAAGKRIGRTPLDRFVIRANAALRDRTAAYLARRPHRSFRRTRRRDYMRSLALPGYLAMTTEASRLLRREWKLFGGFLVLYSVVSGLLLGIVSQSDYSSLTGALRSAGTDFWFQTLSIFGAALTGALSPAINGNTGLVAGLLLVLGWLVLIWLLRHVYAPDRKAGARTRVKLRDALYGAGAPLIPTVLIALVGVIQAVPLLIAIVGYGSASSSGLLDSGIEAMLFFAAAGLLAVLSLYLLTSTFIALVVATLPGMYPVAALKASGDLVIGRRVRLLLRLGWLAVVIVVLWALVLIPVILLDAWVTVDWLPFVPIALLLLSGATLVVSATYIYILYRRLVDDEAGPA